MQMIQIEINGEKLSIFFDNDLFYAIKNGKVFFKNKDYEKVRREVLGY